MNKYVVRPMRHKDKITTQAIVGLQSLEGYDDDDKNRQDEKNEDEEEKLSDEKVDSSDEDMSKKKKSGKIRINLQEKYLVVKRNDELSCVLRISNGVWRHRNP